MTHFKMIAVGLALIAASCSTSKYSKLDAYTNNAYAIAGKANNGQSSVEQATILSKETSANTATNEPVTIEPSRISTLPISQSQLPKMASNQKAHSIAQLQAMVKGGAISMNKKDQKILSKLDQLSNLQQTPLRENPFELTTLAKIIFGVGALGLLGYLLGGGLFFLFLFMVGLGAFICRWIEIIDF